MLEELSKRITMAKVINTKYQNHEQGKQDSYLNHHSEIRICMDEGNDRDDDDVELEAASKKSKQQSSRVVDGSATELIRGKGGVVKWSDWFDGFDLQIWYNLILMSIKTNGCSIMHYDANTHETLSC